MTIIDGATKGGAEAVFEAGVVAVAAGTGGNVVEDDVKLAAVCGRWR